VAAYSLIVALVSLGLMFGAALLAARLRGALPQHHLGEAAKDVISRGTGFVVTLAALVLSLLIASGKNSHDEIDVKLRLLATEFILVDRSLDNYGVEAAETRTVLRRAMTAVMHRIWPGAEPAAPTSGGESARALVVRLDSMIRELKPGNDAQRALQSDALRELTEIMRTGWMLVELSETKMPATFLVILVLWLVIVFFGFGLFAPPNRTVNAALLFCAFVAAGAVFLILELYSPVDGLLAISPRTFEVALEQLGQ
jgi:hypothetical protein